MTQTLSFASDSEYRQLEEYGISVEELKRQWSLLTHAPQRVVLDRPCTVGDGIHQLSPDTQNELIQLHRQSAEQGRWLKFVPASGAASRMFAFPTLESKKDFCESLEKFAFCNDLRAQLAADGRDIRLLIGEQKYDELIAAVVSADGLGYGNLPKALVQFHRSPDRTRTPFEEHLLEGLACLSDRNGCLAAHFTIAADHREAFEKVLRRFTDELSDGRCEVAFSVQDPSTDTIAMAGDGELLRADGRPVMRPGGHGALIENLHRVAGDLIFVKNIDNVAHESRREATLLWTQLLGGYLVQLEAAVHRHLQALESADRDAVVAASDFVRVTFPGAVLPSDHESLVPALIKVLRRPMRICGMVKNEGEPGGGPFWVKEADGTHSLQIVEAAELDDDDDRAKAIFGKSTHFNPVFMALAVRDEHESPFDLRGFVDPNRAIITTKQSGGQKATVLERPGLWNGAMAKWNTIFAEVPKEVFSPVKTVADLLRAEHQP